MLEYLLLGAGIIAGTWLGIFALEVWRISRKHITIGNKILDEEKEIIKALKEGSSNYGYIASGRLALTKKRIK